MSESIRALTVDEIDEVFGGDSCLFCMPVRVCDPGGKNCQSIMQCTPYRCPS